MAEEARTLEMRVAELEDKLVKLTAAPASIPRVCGGYVCYNCYTCYHCVIAQCVIRQCIYECTCGPCSCTPTLTAGIGGGGGFGGLGR
jgi:hypothetical protein